MWKYIGQYLFTAVIAGLFMVGEVLMDLSQSAAASCHCLRIYCRPLDPNLG